MSNWKLEDFEIPEVEGKDRFHDFALPMPLMQAIAELGYEYCTPIQSEALPFALSDYDVTGQAQTGTGKTAAFLIGILARFWETPVQGERELGCPRALILAPTRELAMQIEGDAKSHAPLQIFHDTGGSVHQGVIGRSPAIRTSEVRGHRSRTIDEKHHRRNLLREIHFYARAATGVSIVGDAWPAIGVAHARGVASDATSTSG